MAGPRTVREILSLALDDEEETRETAYKASRELIKQCRQFISLCVDGKEVDEGVLARDAEKILSIFSNRDIRSYPFVEDSLTEYAEAVILSRILHSGEIPLPQEIGVNERAYALGVCDAVGELRRVTLNRLIGRDIEGALSSYERMRDLFSVVEGLTYPSGMIQLKRKQDSARSSIDRTQGEISVALSGMKMIQ